MIDKKKYIIRLRDGWHELLIPDNMTTWAKENSIIWDMLPLSGGINPVLVFDCEDDLLMFRLKFGL